MFDALKTFKPTPKLTLREAVKEIQKETKSESVKTLPKIDRIVKKNRIKKDFMKQTSLNVFFQPKLDEKELISDDSDECQENNISEDEEDVNMKKDSYEETKTSKFMLASDFHRNFKEDENFKSVSSDCQSNNIDIDIEQSSLQSKLGEKELMSDDEHKSDECLENYEVEEELNIRKNSDEETKKSKFILASDFQKNLTSRKLEEDKKLKSVDSSCHSEDNEVKSSAETMSVLKMDPRIRKMREIKDKNEFSTNSGTNSSVQDSLNQNGALDKLELNKSNILCSDLKRKHGEEMSPDFDVTKRTKLMSNGVQETSTLKSDCFTNFKTEVKILENSDSSLKKNNCDKNSYQCLKDISCDKTIMESVIKVKEENVMTSDVQNNDLAIIQAVTKGSKEKPRHSRCESVNKCYYLKAASTKHDKTTVQSSNKINKDTTKLQAIRNGPKDKPIQSRGDLVNKIVKHLMPYYNSKRIFSRDLFKALAKQFSLILMAYRVTGKGILLILHHK